MTLKYMRSPDGTVTPTANLMEWARWFERNKHLRHVDSTDVGEATVSTVFLGIDHDWTGEGPPVLWETMIFGGPHSEDQWRYSSEREAKENHAAIVAALRNGDGPPT